MKNIKLNWFCGLLFVCSPLSSAPLLAEEGHVIAPPSLGQETKGQETKGQETKGQETQETPAAVDEASKTNLQQATTEATSEKPKSKSLFGESKITESRRENGQVYLIELEHSSGSKQYIEENDSDGKIESTSNDIEETPNLPKWKLGSW